ncbi:MAG: asparagine synthase C-terminal domain-containing protein, partial [Candidatus Omnitrophica bacterium]|nr:asparagine synthase C-terminal domain-containing protein [Candidatus Omnitrophota bacterium]
LKQIKKLLPGHYLIIRNNKVEINKYWQFKFFAQKARPEQEYVAEFQRIFKQVVKDQLVADVPVGGFLSGGLDSSGLCYNAYQENPVFKTFNVGFREKTFDEQKYLNRLGTSLRENCYCCELPEDMVPLINQVIDSLDMPVGEGSYLPLYFLSGFAKNKVTVALSGEGADELFGGYEMYLADICAKYYKKISQTLRIKLLKTVIRVLPVDYKWMNPRFSLELFLKGVSENQRIAHYFWREIFSQPEKQFVYNPDFLNSLSKESEADPAYHLFAEKFKSTNSKNFLEQAMFFDTAVCLPDGMLQRVDMSSMHNSLEVRVPYLDNRIVEFAQSLPLSMKIRNFQGKFLLKKAFKHNLAKQILQRRKHGMSAPVSKWLKTNLNEFSYAQFAKTNSPSAGIINQDYVLDMLKKHCQGEIDAGRKLWNLLIFSLWIDKIRS